MKEDNLEFLASEKKRQDRDDLQHEIAGREVGRQRRFLPGSGPQADRIEREKDERRATMTMLQLLLATDPLYAALYQRVAEKLAATDLRLAEMHLEAENLIAERAETLDALRARAGELPDGTKVFRSSNGSVFSEGGGEIGEDERADIRWRSGAPGWEEYQSAKRAHDQAMAYRSEVERVQREVVDPAQARLRDENNPISADELRGIDDDLPEAMERLEATRSQVARGQDMPSDLVAQFRAAQTNVDLATIEPVGGGFSPQRP